MSVTKDKASASRPPAAPPKRSSRKRTVETRERILDAALREFAEVGFEGASTRRIAAEAGLQHGLITYHFDGKDGLWREVLRWIHGEWRDLMAARLQSLEGADPTDTLRVILEDFIRFSARNPRFHAVMSHASSNKNERLDWLVLEYVQPNFATLAQLIRQAQAAGRFVPGDPAKLQYLFIGAAVRVFMVAEEAAVIIGQAPFSDAFVDEHVDQCLKLFFRDPA